jgi:hypothetical protein
MRFFLVLLFGLLLTACSGGSDSSSGNSPGGSSSSSSSSSSGSPVDYLSCGEGCKAYPGAVRPVSTIFSGFAETVEGIWYAPILYNGINWGVIRSNDDGENWVPVDDYQRYPGAEANPNGIVADSLSRIYVCGGAKGNPEAAEDYAWVVRQSNNDGDTFAVSDQFTTAQSAVCNGLAAASSGSVIYAYGKFETDSAGGSVSNSLVRYTNNGGTSWSDFYSENGPGIVDMKIAANGDIYLLDADWRLVRSDDNGQNWQPGAAYSSGGEQFAGNMAIASNGTVYVAGLVENDTNPYRWRLVYTSNMGVDWTEVGALFGYSDSPQRRPVVLISSNHVLFIAGGYRSYDSILQNWVESLRILKSVDDGGSWESVYDNGYVVDVNRNGEYKIMTGNNDNLVVAGLSGKSYGTLAVMDDNGKFIEKKYSVTLPAYTSATAGAVIETGAFLTAGYEYDHISGTSKWIVKHTADVGASWNTIDELGTFQDPANPFDTISAYPFRILADLQGNYYAGGNSDSLYSQWVLRRSINEGMTWSAVEPCVDVALYTTFLDMTIDDAGNLYLLGHYDDILASDGNHVFICVSGNNGNSWDLFSDFEVENDSSVQFDGVNFIRTANGSIYLFGDASFNDHSMYEWFTLISNNGIDWQRYTILDKNSFLPWIFDVQADTLGNLFVTSYDYNEMLSRSDWRVMASADNGVNWQESDVVSSTVIGAHAYGKALAIDSSGNIYSAGILQEVADGPFSIIIKRSTDQGLSWTITDDWSPVNDDWTNVDIWDLLIDDAGNMIQLGTITAANGMSYSFQRQVLL